MPQSRCPALARMMVAATSVTALTVVTILLAVAALSPGARAQVLIGYDGVNIDLLEFTSTPGGICAAPNPDGFLCDAEVPAPCVGTSTLFPIMGPLDGDVASDPVTDTTYVTDGRVVLAFVGDTPCGAAPPCTVVSGFIPNIVVPALGPITGLGCDGDDPAAGGAPVVYVTDGFTVAGLIPPAVCGAPPTVLYGPCVAPSTVQPVTDLDWDPQRSGLWAISETGSVQIMAPATCAPGPPPVSVAACGISGPFTGLAYDINTPNPLPSSNMAWVCNAAGEVAYIDTYSGLPGTPSFAGPDPCTTASTGLAGLAAANRGVTFGAPRDVVTIGTFGQCTTPSSTFGIEITGAPSTGATFVVVNYNIPGPGFICPPGAAVGTTLYVDPTPPGTFFLFPPLGPGCSAFSFPVPSGIVPGFVFYIQFIFMDGTPPALDATAGLACTVGYP